MEQRTHNPTQSNSLLISHTQLWVGQHDAVVAHITLLLQKKFCANQGCNTCIVCMQVRDQQHHAIMWMKPEKTYTKDQFDDLFKTASFALDTNHHYFFIIQKADFLPPAPANRLLKLLEEPPAGYHFILIAERTDQLLPTIKSRCVINQLGNIHEIQKHPLFTYFCANTTRDPIQFLKTADQSKINERESVELLDALMRYWTHQYKTNNSNQKQAQKMISVLKKGYSQLPMPGSSKIFWKNIYLAAHQ